MNRLSNKRILVTGATGKVGQAFIGRLLDDPARRDFRVRALCHNRVLPVRDRLEVVHGSIDNHGSVLEAMAGTELRPGKHQGGKQ